ncbi:tetratricopeptide repeat protein [bacterium]|nr:MAG: tetratricopeptide repeat protein [bacterium]
MSFVRLIAVLSAVTFVAGSLAAASADNAYQYYFPPKLISRAATAVPAQGKGKVVVQVLLDERGNVAGTRIISSTNTGDEAAALDIARRSKYAPARRGPSEQKAKAQKGFYDFTLLFSAAGGVATQGPVDAAIVAINKSEYAAARDALAPYVQQNPGDGKAQALLGIAQYYLKDYTAAAAAFDQAGAAIPTSYKAVAADAYAHVTQANLAKNDGQGALVSAKRAVALAPAPALYNLLGGAEIAAGDFKAAVGDISRARDGAAAAKMAPSDRATIDVNLARAYANAGDAENAQKYVNEAKGLDSNADTTGVLGAVYLLQARAKAESKDYAGAAKLYEQAGAGLSGKNAATAYTNAAFQYLSIAHDQDPKTAAPTYDAALADVNRALAAQPKFAAALYAQGAVLANQGKKDEAISALKQADAAATAAGDSALASSVEKTLKQLQGGS